MDCVSKDCVSTKRQLTQDEIQIVKDVIKIGGGIPKEVADSIKERIEIKLVEQLNKIKVYPEVISKLKEEVERRYYKSQLDPGEMVGILSSTYMAEIITQLTLSSFHFAGLSSFSISLGVPRFEEILNASKVIKQPSMTLSFETKDSQSSGESDFDSIYQICNNKIKQTLLSEYITDIQPEISYYRKLSPEETILYNVFYELESDIVKREDFGWSIRLYLDNDVIYRTRSKIRDIAKRIEMYRDLHCVFLPESFNISGSGGVSYTIIDVYVDTTNVEVPQINSKDFPTQPAYPHLNESNVNHYYIKNVVIPNLLELQILGITDVTRVHYRRGSPDLLCKFASWVVETNGSNLRDIFALEEVNFKDTLTNDIYEIYQTLGIEATRNVIIIEMKKIISGLLDCHFEIVANAQTHTGKYTGVSRYGIDRTQIGPLTKMSFEESFKNVVDSGIKEEVEDLIGVSASITTGKTAKLGTGYFKLLLNKDALVEPENRKESTTRYEFVSDLTECLDRNFVSEPPAEKDDNELTFDDINFNDELEMREVPEENEENDEEDEDKDEEDIPQYKDKDETSLEIIKRIKDKTGYRGRSPSRSIGSNSSKSSKSSEKSSFSPSITSKKRVRILGNVLEKWN